MAALLAARPPALSRLFKRACAEGYALTNPVALVFDKPRIEGPEATWLTIEEGIDKRITLHTLRHTYCAARLQTYHQGPHGHGIQIGVYQVAREMGHRSTAMVEQVYGHVVPRPENLQAEVPYRVGGT